MMNKPSVGRQALYETLNVLLSSLLNDLGSSRLEQRYRLLFERGNSRVASRFDNFVGSYDSMCGSGLLDQPIKWLYISMNSGILRDLNAWSPNAALTHLSPLFGLFRTRGMVVRASTTVVINSTIWASFQAS
jgi:hypothetical protein